MLGQRPKISWEKGPSEEPVHYEIALVSSLDSKFSYYYAWVEAEHGSNPRLMRNIERQKREVFKTVPDTGKMSEEEKLGGPNNVMAANWYDTLCKMDDFWGDAAN